jgi:hypothetical protein
METQEQQLYLEVAVKNRKIEQSDADDAAIYLTALALLLFQSGFAFSLVVFSFLPRVDDRPRRPGQDLEED